MFDSPATESDGAPSRHDDGFTLIEILIAIVLVGILSAVAVVGISNLVSKGGTSACNATRDAATAASTVYYASNATYPINFTALTTGNVTIPAALTLNPPVQVGTSKPLELWSSSANPPSWKLTMSTPGSATTAPVFSVCV